MFITNHGPDIASTDYWQTEHANVGLCYLSGNAGAWRLLVPEAAEGMLPEMRTGRSVTIEPSRATPNAVDLVFDDGTASPFWLTVDRKQLDRPMQPGARRLTVWTERGMVLDLPSVQR